MSVALRGGRRCRVDCHSRARVPACFGRLLPAGHSAWPSAPLVRAKTRWANPRAQMAQARANAAFATVIARVTLSWKGPATPIWYMSSPLRMCTSNPLEKAASPRPETSLNFAAYVCLARSWVCVQLAFWPPMKTRMATEPLAESHWHCFVPCELWPTPSLACSPSTAEASPVVINEHGLPPALPVLLLPPPAALPAAWFADVPLVEVDVDPPFEHPTSAATATIATTNALYLMIPPARDDPA